VSDAAGVEWVVLVHGLWMHGTALTLQRYRIARSGYRAVTYSYPTMRLTLALNARRLGAFCATLDDSRIHLLGHSLGGIVILDMLRQAPPAHPGRIVLLGSPYRGSAAAVRLGRSRAGRLLLGDSIGEWLHRDKADDWSRYEIGVIAGSRSHGLGRMVTPALSVPNDGVVSVAETCVPGMRAQLVLPVSHTGMMFSKAVAQQALAFIDRGCFCTAAAD
jgi:pimeloyl-ACP methyl ester carboxylesterase